MTQKTTVKHESKRPAAKRRVLPAGLLQFHPLHQGRAMSYFALRGDEVTIGRDEGCTIQIDDNEASREHAKIQRSKKVWQLNDCDSTNGVFVNARQVSSQLLVGGEVIRIGLSLFRFFSRGLASEDRIWPLTSGPMVTGPAFDELRTLLDQAAGSDLSVLVTGETGTGKELIASHLHSSGPRSEEPFVAVNCSAIPAQLIESELFGHEKGAFTGATASQTGLIRLATRGTLFLDEIGDMPLDSQVKLLRVLQERIVRPVGSTKAYEVDIRVISATNRDLEERVREGKFRADLYARVAELVVQLPPLRQRREDVPILVEHFLDRHGGGRERSVTTEAMEELSCRGWPYNIRELESAVRRALVLAGAAAAAEIEPEHFVEKVTTPPLAAATSMSEDVGPRAEEDTTARVMSKRESRQAEVLCMALERHNGDTVKAAEELGISRSQLYRRAKKLCIDVTDYRE